MTSNLASRRIFAAVIALVATAALHGGWLSDLGLGTAETAAISA